MSLRKIGFIGDSITMGPADGYGYQHQRLLAHYMDEIHLIPENATNSTYAAANIATWLSGFGADAGMLIHFNVGQHDIKAATDTPKATYQDNIQSLIDAIEGTGAKPLWGSTTPVLEGVVGDTGRTIARVQRNNAWALEVVRDNGIGWHDIYQFAIDSDVLKVSVMDDGLHINQGAESKVFMRKIRYSIQGFL